MAGEARKTVTIVFDAGSEERLDSRRGCTDAAAVFLRQRGVGGQGVDQDPGLFVVQRLQSEARALLSELTG